MNMLSWLTTNGGTICVIVLLLLVTGGILTGLVRNRKQGTSSCGCGCSNCPMSGSCHTKK